MIRPPAGVLFVCLGNICRSPTAEYVARTEFEKLGLQIPVASRGLGNWQAELAEWAGLFVAAHSGLKALAEAAAGLQVDESRMLANLGSLRGVVHAEAVSMRLARVIGKPKAQALLEKLSRQALAEGVELKTLALKALADDAMLSANVPGAEVEVLFDPNVAAASAIARAEDALARLRPQAKALAAAQPWGHYPGA